MTTSSKRVKTFKVGDIVLWDFGEGTIPAIGFVLREKTIRAVRYSENFKMWDVHWLDTSEVCEYSYATMVSMRQTYEKYQGARKKKNKKRI